MPNINYNKVNQNNNGIISSNGSVEEFEPITKRNNNNNNIEFFNALEPPNGKFFNNKKHVNFSKATYKVIPHKENVNINNEYNYNNIPNKNISTNPNKNINTNPNEPIDNAYKSILKYILLINFDEKKKEFKNISNTPIQSYLDENKIKDIQKYAIIVVCTQNSLSGTENHFQHHFKEFIEKKDFTMLSKVDATRQTNRRSLLGSKRYNVRTRVYYNKKKVNLFFNPINFKTSYNKKKNENGTAWENKREIKTYIDEKQKTINNYRECNFKSCKNFNKINIYSYSIHRKSQQDNKGNPIFGEGLIDVNFGFIVNRAGTLKNEEKFLSIRNYNGDNYLEIPTKMPDTLIYICNSKNVRICKSSYFKNNIKNINNTNKLIKIMDLNRKPIIDNIIKLEKNNSGFFKKNPETIEIIKRIVDKNKIKFKKNKKEAIKVLYEKLKSIFYHPQNNLKNINIDEFLDTLKHLEKKNHIDIIKNIVCDENDNENIMRLINIFDKKMRDKKNENKRFDYFYNIIYKLNYYFINYCINSSNIINGYDDMATIHKICLFDMVRNKELIKHNIKLFRHIMKCRDIFNHLTTKKNDDKYHSFLYNKMNEIIPNNSNSNSSGYTTDSMNYDSMNEN